MVVAKMSLSPMYFDINRILEPNDNRSGVSNYSIVYESV